MEPFQTKNLLDLNGTQRIYKFENGYGASLVRHSGSYGNESGLYEIAVIQWTEPDVWEITYSTPITKNVLGWLNWDVAMSALERIEALEPEDGWPADAAQVIEHEE